MDSHYSIKLDQNQNNIKKESVKQPKKIAPKCVKSKENNKNTNKEKDLDDILALIGLEDLVEKDGTTASIRKVRPSVIEIKKSFRKSLRK